MVHKVGDCYPPVHVGLVSKGRDPFWGLLNETFYHSQTRLGYYFVVDQYDPKQDLTWLKVHRATTSGELVPAGVLCDPVPLRTWVARALVAYSHFVHNPSFPSHLPKEAFMPKPPVLPTPNKAGGKKAKSRVIVPGQPIGKKPAKLWVPQRDNLVLELIKYEPEALAQAVEALVKARIG